MAREPNPSPSREITPSEREREPAPSALALAPQDALQSFNQLEVGMERARKIANALKHLVDEKRLSVAIGRKDHLLVEAWCALGTMVGVSPMTEWTRAIVGAETVAYEARVLAIRVATGAVICAAESDCWADEVQELRGEGGYWHRWVAACPRHEQVPTTPCAYPPTRHAIRSMAQTRATSKALAQALRWIVVLAGYSGTPAEEMTHVRDGGERGRDPSFERGAERQRAEREPAPSAPDGRPSGQAQSTRREWENSSAGTPPAPGKALPKDQISEGKIKMIHALARKRAEELGERWDKDRLIGRLCQALTVEHEEEIHWRNFGNQKQPDRFPNWVELFLETWEPPDGDGPPPEDGSTDEAAGRAFVDDDAGHPYDRGR